MLALYVASDQVSTLYGDPLCLWGHGGGSAAVAGPDGRLAMAGLMDDDPVLFATRDAVSWGAPLATGSALCWRFSQLPRFAADATTAVVRSQRLQGW